jgi:hypothetical protein
MKKIARNVIPWEVKTRVPDKEIDHREIEAFLDDFQEVDVFAFLGVPDHSREKYMEHSLEMLIELDKASKVFAPKAYEDFLEEELRGLKVNYHSPDSRREEFQNIAEATEDIENIIAPTVDYTVPRNYAEASRVFEDIQTPQDNILVDFEDFRQTDGSILSYLIADLYQTDERGWEEASTDYDIHESDIVLPGINYSGNAEDYFGLNFFSPDSEAVRSVVPEKAKEFVRNKMRSGY